jgi:hypothetical protein
MPIINFSKNDLQDFFSKARSSGGITPQLRDSWSSKQNKNEFKKIQFVWGHPIHSCEINLIKAWIHQARNAAINEMQFVMSTELTPETYFEYRFQQDFIKMLVQECPAAIRAKLFWNINIASTSAAQPTSAFVDIALAVQCNCMNHTRDSLRSYPTTFIMCESHHHLVVINLKMIREKGVVDLDRSIVCVQQSNQSAVTSPASEDAMPKRLREFMIDGPIAHGRRCVSAAAAGAPCTKTLFGFTSESAPGQREALVCGLLGMSFDRWDNGRGFAGGPNIFLRFSQCKDARFKDLGARIVDDDDSEDFLLIRYDVEDVQSSMIENLDEEQLKQRNQERLAALKQTNPQAYLAELELIEIARHAKLKAKREKEQKEKEENERAAAVAAAAAAALRQQEDGLRREQEQREKIEMERERREQEKRQRKRQRDRERQRRKRQEQREQREQEEIAEREQQEEEERERQRERDERRRREEERERQRERDERRRREEERERQQERDERLRREQEQEQSMRLRRKEQEERLASIEREKIQQQQQQQQQQIQQQQQQQQQIQQQQQQTAQKAGEFTCEDCIKLIAMIPVGFISLAIFIAFCQEVSVQMSLKQNHR